MSTIADYPDGVSTAGPFINRLIDQPAEYEVDMVRYEDGGVDVNVQPCGLKPIVLEYEGLTIADMETLRTHYNLAKGRINNFSFYHRRSAVTYSSVTYRSWAIGRHNKTWTGVLSVTLVRLA